MVDVYTVGQVGIEFSGQLEEEGNPYDEKIKPLVLTNYSRVYVKFWRPDGTTFEKDAEPRDPSTLTDTDIKYDVDSETLFDEKSRGDWAYTVGAEFTNRTKIESNQRVLFWVI